METLLKVISDNLTERYAVVGGDSQTVTVKDKEIGEIFDIKVAAL